MTSDLIHQEATLTLLEDLRTALSHILPDLVPSMPVRLTIVPGERPRLVIELSSDESIYPYVQLVRRGEVRLRPSAYLRERPQLFDDILSGRSIPADAWSEPV